MTIALCLLVWNEAHGCQVELPKINFSHFDQVFAIDGGSTDGTIEILENAGIEVVEACTLVMLSIGNY